MSATHEFYLVRAQEARAAAADSTLENVRERHLRAAEAWEAMAARIMRTDLAREKQAAAKAAAWVANS